MTAKRLSDRQANREIRWKQIERHRLMQPPSGLQIGQPGPNPARDAEIERLTREIDRLREEYPDSVPRDGATGLPLDDMLIAMNPPQ